MASPETFGYTLIWCMVTDIKSNTEEAGRDHFNKWYSTFNDS
jgi:hypothetical protein